VRILVAALLLVTVSCSNPSNETTIRQTTTLPPTITTTSPTTTTAATTTAATAASGTTSTTTTTTLPELRGLGYRVIAVDLSQPVLAFPAGDRLMVLERRGTVISLDPDNPEERTVFADLTDRVLASGIEQGLLGMAFYPGDSSRVFVYYVGRDGNSRLSEFRTENGLLAPGTERELLGFDQAIIRHYGGMVAFGPDGYLYVSLGEGGAAATHSQDPNTLLSSILRIDVDDEDAYAIPESNPFVAGGGAPEVWAFGLRNPWRFSIDPVEHLIYVADVGHERTEELNVVPLGAGGYNFGWWAMEGSACFRSGCDPEGLTFPVYEYPHTEGCSITGGFVYRGTEIPELVGEYFFSDWCSGFLRSYREGRVTDWTGEPIGQVNGFGIDRDGELYVLTWKGILARIIPLREG